MTGPNPWEGHRHTEEEGYTSEVGIPSERSKGRKPLGQRSVVTATECPKNSLEEAEKECVQTGKKEIRVEPCQGSRGEEIQGKSGQHH